MGPCSCATEGNSPSMVCQYGREEQHTPGKTIGCPYACHTYLDTGYTGVDCDGWHPLIPASLGSGEVAKWQILQDGPLPTNPPTTAVVADKLLCQLHTKISDVLELGAGSIVLVQYKCIGNRNVE